MFTQNLPGSCPYGIDSDMLDCVIAVSEFRLQSCYYVHFWTNTIGKGMNSLLFPAVGLRVTLLFFYKDGLGIELPKMVDMPIKRNSTTSVPL